MTFFSRLQERMVDFSDQWVYLAVIFIAALPLWFSWQIGIAHTRQLPASFASGTQPCLGYWTRLNWTSLVFLLPMALFLIRWTTNRLFPLGNQGSAAGAGASQSTWKDLMPFVQPLFRFDNLYRISDRTGDPGASGKLLRAAALDGRNLLAAFIITLLIHAIDLGPYLRFYFSLLWGKSVTSRPPVIWDWVLFCLTAPHDRGLLYKNLILVLLAYGAQFVLVTIAILLLVLLLRHNVFYLGRIYLRSRGANEAVPNFIVLDLEAQDNNFGLRKLSAQFNIQIMLLALAGCFTLVSRITNSDTSALHKFLQSFSPSEKIAWDAFSQILNNYDALFPTIGQKMFPIAWLALFVLVMLPARVKLLPLKVLPPTNDGAADYLREFLVPGSSIDQKTESLKKQGSVNEVAALFASHSFWPVGDTRAQSISIGAFFMFFFMLSPILPTISDKLGPVLYILILIFCSYTCSNLLFGLFKYRLKAVDPRLVKKDSE
jgi:hypothetical protein